MGIIASDILSRVRTQLVDSGSVRRWTDAELLQWLSDGQRTVVALQPAAANKVVSVPLVAGARQAIPADGYVLLDVICNCNADGSVPGRTVRVTPKESLDTLNPSWMAASRSSVAQNYTYDPNDQTHFMVYPPNDGSGHVLMNYAEHPAELAATTDTLVVNEIYRTALVDYVLFRSHQKDSDFAGGAGPAQMYFQTFAAFMGQQPGAQLDDSPNQQLGAPNPSSKGSAK
jgi:hypothetical protein